MIIDLLLAAAIVAAVMAFWLRRRRRVRLRVAARTRPGSTSNPIYVRSYAEIDDHLARRWCHCGGYVERQGEGTRESDGRRFRVARVACQECEDVSEVVFDTTDVLH